MNITITGALGHIGSELIRNLDITGVEKMYLVDNLHSKRYSSLFDLPSNVNFIFKELDILDPAIEEIIKESDVVVHLAAITNAQFASQNKKIVDRINVQGTDHIIKLCSKYDASLIFPSTTSVYGISRENISEDIAENGINPQTYYAQSKRQCEVMIESYVKKRQLKAIIFRFGTIYGFSQGMAFHTAVNRFIWQAVCGQKINVWKTAMQQRRPYLSLKDAIFSIRHVIENNIFDGQIYNIVSNNLTVEEILTYIKDLIPDVEVSSTISPIMNDLSYSVSNSRSLSRGFTYAADIKGDIKNCIEKLYSINSQVKKKI